MTIEAAAVQSVPRPTATAWPAWMTAIGRVFDRLLWLEACILLTLAHVLLGGYRLGAGNQAIQIPFVKRLLDPTLYPNDPLVNTISEYPTFFFRGVAWLLRYFELAPTYFCLHVLTAALVFIAAYGLAKSIFRDRLAGIMVVLMLFAGHHRALGGDDLYSLGFTHTWAVFPLAIGTLILFYRERLWAAFILAGLIFNLHALTAGYLMAMMGLWLLLDVRRTGLLKTAGLLLAAALPALPTVALMVQHPQSFDAQWINLTWMRSADHSFPSSWWQPGAVDVPRFAVIVALAALSLSFRAPPAAQRKSIIIACAVALLFVAGYVFSEIWPVKTVLRAQLFRSSRLLMVIMFAHIAYWVACAWRMALGRVEGVSGWRGGIELVAANVALLCLAVPPLMPYLPAALALAAIVALVNGRLSWWQAGITGAAFVLLALAWHKLHLTVLPRPGHQLWRQALEELRGWEIPFWIGLVGGAGLWLVSRLSVGPRLRVLLLLQGAACIGLLVVTIYKPLVRAEDASDPWIDVQRWARNNTPKDAVFLTPAQPGGFRLHSERPVVCEWRDGTQMYFSASFAREWFRRLNALRRDMVLDARGRNVLSYKPLERLGEEEIIRTAKEYQAQYIVLPLNRERNLRLVYSNSAWGVFAPEMDAPPGVIDKKRWYDQRDFLQNVAEPSIEKHRKGDMRLELVDASGRPLAEVPCEVSQTRHAFGFGCSLPFFLPESIGADGGDVILPPVHEKELARFLEVFNYSVIAYSGKWVYIEREEGKRYYDDLDRYVDWCVKNNIEMEFHYITGIFPRWLRTKTPSEQAEALARHARDLIARYGDRIKIWQVVNDKYLLRYTPPIFEEIRKTRPELKLGISDCTRFYRAPGAFVRPELDIYRGIDEVRMLKAQGIQLDYFAPHGHSPHGVWCDLRQMWDTFDKFAAEGVRVRVTEFMVPLGREIPYDISGPIRRGKWNNQLRADFFEMFYTACFAHPAVDAVNYWLIGPHTVTPRSGLLDENYEPMPEFLRLKELIRGKWWTKASGNTDAAGAFNMRGFYGDYELTVTLPSGKTVKGSFSIVKGGATVCRLKVDEEKGVIQRM